MEIFWLLFTLYAVISGSLASTIASKKGHAGDSWFAAGLFFGVLGLIAAAGLPDRHMRDRAGSSGRLGMARQCPDCAELIKTDALVCRYCGYRFDAQTLIAEAVSALQGDEPEMRAGALRVLVRLGDETVTPHLVKVLPQSTVADRVLIVDKLRSLGASSAVPTLLDAFLEASNLPYESLDACALRRALARALAELADASIGDELARFLSIPMSNSMKSLVIWLVGAVGALSAVPALVGAVHRANAVTVKEHAINTLKALGPPAIQVLRQERVSARNRSVRRTIGHLIEAVAPSDD